MTMRIPTEEELNAPKCPKCGAILKQIGHPGDFDYMCPNCTKVTVIDNPEITGYSLTERGIEVDGFTEKIKLPKASIGVGVLNPRPNPKDNLRCHNCNGPFGEFLYHHLLDNTLWCEGCAEEAVKASGHGNASGNVEYTNNFAKAPTSMFPLPKCDVDPQKVFDALMDPEVDDFIDSTRDMEEEDGEEDDH